MATATEAPAAAGGLVPHTPFQFQQAEKEARPARIAFDGPSGSGRTLTALRVASALGENIAVIETEHGHSHQYGAEVPFRSTVLSDFNPDHLFAALASAAVLGHDVVVIDSYTQFWTGMNGMIDKVQTDTRPGYGGQNEAWHKNRPMERRITEALLAYPGHLVMTLRSDTETVTEPDAQGRTITRKVAVKPKQRADIEYDLDVAGTLGPVATLHVGKSRIPALVNKVEYEPGVEMGKVIRAWAEEGKSTGDWLGFVRRARDPEATSEGLRLLWLEVSKARCQGMAVLDEHGQHLTLADLIRERGHYLAQQEAAVGALAQDGVA